MTLYEFNDLDMEERAAIAVQGKFVDLRFETGLKVALYRHPGFYAEVFYDGESNRITRSRGFISVSELAAYIHLQ